MKTLDMLPVHCISMAILARLQRQWDNLLSKVRYILHEGLVGVEYVRSDNNPAENAAPTHWSLKGQKQSAHTIGYDGGQKPG